MSGGRRLDWIVTAALGVAAFILYLATLAPTVLPGDPGEFQLGAYLAGVVHATGYPLYCLLGWVWSHALPVGDPAYRMNLFSALWGALAVALLYPTAGLVLRGAVPGLPPAARRAVAALAAATFAVTPTFWSQAVIAEVYTLHIFLAVALFYSLLRWSDAISGRDGGRAACRLPLVAPDTVLPDPVRARAACCPLGHWPAGQVLLLAACFFSLGLAHHRTMLLLLPGAVAYVWLVRRQAARPGVPGAAQPVGRRGWLAAALLVVAPLALYLYIPLRAPRTPYLTVPLGTGRELVLYENTLPALIDFVLGGPFGGSIDLSAGLGGRLAMAGRLLYGEVGWVGLGLALAGVAWLAARAMPAGSRPREQAPRLRPALLALTGLAFLGTVAFNLVYTIGDIYVLFIPAYLVVVLWLAVGVGALALAAGRWLPARTPRALLIGLLAVVAAWPLGRGAGRYAGLDQSGRTEARAAWQAILAEPLPQGAILVSDDRNDLMPMWYLQHVEGRRSDLAGVFPLIAPAYPTVGRVLDLALGTGRPVYLIKDMPGIEVKVETAPAGRLWRVTGPAAGREPAIPVQARFGDTVALAGYDVSPGSPEPGGTLRVQLYWEPLRPPAKEYHTFVHVVDAGGDKIAQSDRQPGGAFYPSTMWRPGERLRDDHALSIPPGAPAGTYRLVVGLYALPDEAEGALEPLWEPVELGTVAIQPGTP